MSAIVKNWTWQMLGLLLVLVVASGCRQRQGVLEIPRSAGSAAVGDGSVFFVRWKDGPAVMICYDFNGRSSKAPVGSGNGSTFSNAPLFCKVYGFQTSADGRRFDWSMETADGRSVKCVLDGKEYDLAKGTLFLVNTRGAKTEVEQRTKDLSAVQPDVKGFEVFAREDAEVGKFLGLKAH